MAILNIGIKIKSGSSSTGSGALFTTTASEYAEVTTVAKSTIGIVISGQSISSVPQIDGSYKYTVPPGKTLSITGTHGTSWVIFGNTQ